MTISNDEAILQKMLSTMETLRTDQLRLAEQVYMFVIIIIIILLMCECIV